MGIYGKVFWVFIFSETGKYDDYTLQISNEKNQKFLFKRNTRNIKKYFKLKNMIRKNNRYLNIYCLEN